MTDELDVETQRRHIREMFRLLELKRLAAANAIDAAQQTELDDLQARTDAAFEAERATPKQTDVARAARSFGPPEPPPSAELSPRTFWIVAREFSSFGRQGAADGPADSDTGHGSVGPLERRTVPGSPAVASRRTDL